MAKAMKEKFFYVFIHFFGKSFYYHA